MNVLSRSQVRGIGTTEPKSYLATGSTEMEMSGEMAENDEKNE